MSRELTVSDVKALRVDIDASIQSVEFLKSMGDGPGRELSLVKTKLQEAKMWCGKALEEMGHELPQEYQDKASSEEVE